MRNKHRKHVEGGRTRGPAILSQAGGYGGHGGDVLSGARGKSDVLSGARGRAKSKVGQGGWGKSGEGDIWVRWAKMQFSNFPLSSIRCMVQLFLVSSRICWVYCPSASRVERAENRQADSAGSMVARSFCDNHRSKGTKNRTQTQVLRTTGFI